ncbi:phage head closure protein [Acinetobacter pittii]|uniref:phage head closure protein n=1 Tax=Acinetobacter pittii TaxID=48296 RepID=UPI00226E87D1|nr:phage head closure protein [Acinetobacter pittii]
MKAGELRHRVIIQKHQLNGRDENGNFLPGRWVDYKTLWSKVTHVSGKDLIASQANNSQIVARLKIRYRTDIDTTMRVIHKGIVYAIDSPALDDSGKGNEYCTFMLSGGIERFPD